MHHQIIVNETDIVWKWFTSYLNSLLSVQSNIQAFLQILYSKIISPQFLFLLHSTLLWFSLPTNTICCIITRLVTVSLNYCLFWWVQTCPLLCPVSLSLFFSSSLSHLIVILFFLNNDFFFFCSVRGQSLSNPLCLHFPLRHLISSVFCPHFAVCFLPATETVVICGRIFCWTHSDVLPLPCFLNKGQKYIF